MRWCIKKKTYAGHMKKKIKKRKKKRKKRRKKSFVFTVTKGNITDIYKIASKKYNLTYVQIYK